MNVKYYVTSEPNYIFIKISPKNKYSNENLNITLHTFMKFYHDMLNRIDSSNKKLGYRNNPSVSYYIYNKNNNIDYFFSIPEPHFNSIRTELLCKWDKSFEIQKVDRFPKDLLECKVGTVKKKESNVINTCIGVIWLINGVKYLITLL